MKLSTAKILNQFFDQLPDRVNTGFSQGMQMGMAKARLEAQMAEAEKQRRFQREMAGRSQEFQRQQEESQQRFRTSERLGAESFAGKEAQIGRRFKSAERYGRQKFLSGEAEAERKARGEASKTEREFRTSEREASEKFAGKERAAERYHRNLQARANDLSRSIQRLRAAAANPNNRASANVLNQHADELQKELDGVYMDMGVKKIPPITPATDFEDLPQQQQAPTQPVQTPEAAQKEGQGMMERLKSYFSRPEGQTLLPSSSEVQNILPESLRGPGGFRGKVGINPKQSLSPEGQATMQRRMNLESAVGGGIGSAGPAVSALIPPAAPLMQRMPQARAEGMKQAAQFGERQALDRGQVAPYAIQKQESELISPQSVYDEGIVEKWRQAMTGRNLSEAERLAQEFERTSQGDVSDILGGMREAMKMERSNFESAGLTPATIIPAWSEAVSKENKAEANRLFQRFKQDNPDNIQMIKNMEDVMLEKFGQKKTPEQAMNDFNTAFDRAINAPPSEDKARWATVRSAINEYEKAGGDIHVLSSMKNSIKGMEPEAGKELPGSGDTIKYTRPLFTAGRGSAQLWAKAEQGRLRDVSPYKLVALLEATDNKRIRENVTKEIIRRIPLHNKKKGSISKLNELLYHAEAGNPEAADYIRNLIRRESRRKERE